MFIPAPPEWVAAGAWLQQHTGAQDFVVYLREAVDTHPGPLYFARRDGINLAVEQLSAGRLRQTGERYVPSQKRLLVFWPRWVRRTELSELLAPKHLIAGDPERGRLYSLPK
jgi:hypothetical protein